MKARMMVLSTAALLTAIQVIPRSENAHAQQKPTQEKSEKPKDQSDTESRVDPKADELLRKMSDYLGGLRSFTVVAEHETEVVLPSGQKLQYVATSKAAVRRPNRFRSDRVGQVAEMSFYYDGKSLTLYGAKTGYYATAAAPPTIDGAIDFARERIDVELPAADLIYADAYRMLMVDVVSGTVVGKSHIDNVPVVHLAFRGNETDWQIWIEDDATPLPRKYLIVTKDMTAQPEFTVELHDWDVALKLSDDVFEFEPPQGAKQIEFLGLQPKSKQEPGK